MPDIFLRQGEANPNDIKLRDTTLADSGGGFTSTATWDQAPASWAATATETFASTATYVQAAATWQATASEAYPSSATWLQAAATWAAVANEAFAATGSFTQAAAAWSAIAAETFATTATWAQATAAWTAAEDEAFNASGAWLQATASWAATANNVAGPLSFTGSWTQTAIWDATANSADAACDEGFQAGAFQGDAFQECVPDGVVVGSGGGKGLTRLRTIARAERVPIPANTFAAEFVQAPAGWKADVDTFDDDSWLVLFDEPALIGAR